MNFAQVHFFGLELNAEPQLYIPTWQYLFWRANFSVLHYNNVQACIRTNSQIVQADQQRPPKATLVERWSDNGELQKIPCCLCLMVCSRYLHTQHI